MKKPGSDSDPTQHMPRGAGDPTITGIGATGVQRVLWRENDRGYQRRGDEAIIAMDEALKSPLALGAAYDLVRRQYRMDVRTSRQLSYGESVGLIGPVELPGRNPIGLVLVGQRTVLDIAAIRPQDGNLQLEIKNLTAEQALRTAFEQRTQGLGLDRDTLDEVERQQQIRVKEFTTTILPDQTAFVGRKPAKPETHQTGRPYMLSRIVDAGDRQASRTHLAIDCFVMPVAAENQLFVNVQDLGAPNRAEIYPAGTIQLATES